MSEFGFALLIFIAGHAIGDVVLQPGHLSAAKRPGGSRSLPWPVAIGFHSIIHGAIVAIIVQTFTGSAATALWLGVAEVIAHASIDTAKVHSYAGPEADQALHVACKAVWAMIAIGTVA